MEKFLLTLEFLIDNNTVEGVKIINKTENEKVETKKTKKTTTKSSGVSVEGMVDDIPCIVLEEGRMVLNELAITMIGVEAGNGDRVHIKYKTTKGVTTPLIAHNEVFGVKAGNVLHKNCTVTFKGKNNEVLSEYGTVFKLVEQEDGIFAMIDIDADDSVETIDNISMPKTVKSPKKEKVGNSDDLKTKSSNKASATETIADANDVLESIDSIDTSDFINEDGDFNFDALLIGLE